MESKACMAGQPEHSCRLAEAGRGWPRLAEAGGRPELDLAALFHIGEGEYEPPWIVSLRARAAASSERRVATLRQLAASIQPLETSLGTLGLSARARLRVGARKPRGERLSG